MQQTAPAGKFEGSLDVGCYGLNARVAMALAWVWAWRPDAGASEAKFLPPSPPPPVFSELREARLAASRSGVARWSPIFGFQHRPKRQG